MKRKEWNADSESEQDDDSKWAEQGGSISESLGGLINEKKFKKTLSKHATHKAAQMEKKAKHAKPAKKAATANKLSTHNKKTGKAGTSAAAKQA